MEGFIMNSKKILGTLIAALVITVSTSALAFASENVSKSTKDVVKVEATKTKAVKNQSQNQSTAAADTSASTGILSLTNDQVAKIAKQAVNKQFGADIDKEGFTEAKFYWPKDFNKGVDNSAELIKLGLNPQVNVEFHKPNYSSEPNYMWDDVNVGISLTDGKVKEIQYYNNIDGRLADKARTQYDNNRVKSVMIQFLKDKGFDTNYKNIRIGGPKTCTINPISSSYVDYPDGTTKWIEVNILNYTVVGYGSTVPSQFRN